MLIHCIDYLSYCLLPVFVFTILLDLKNNVVLFSHYFQALSTGGNSGATKRKAAPPPLAKINELSKKPHPESAPLTAIANDEHASSAEAASCVRRPSLCRRLTYAEIVKFGINGDLESKLEGETLVRVAIFALNQTGSYARRSPLAVSQHCVTTNRFPTLR